VPPRSRFVEKAKYSNCVRKSEEFERAAEGAAAQGDWDATVSNAIHSGISMADGVAVFYLGKRSAAQGHDEAVSILRQLDIVKEQVEIAASHLTELLKVRNAAEYEERLLSRRDSEIAMKHLRRFITWARGTLPR